MGVELVKRETRYELMLFNENSRGYIVYNLYKDFGMAYEVGETVLKSKEWYIKEITIVLNIKG